MASEVRTNKLSPASGVNLTLGDSGDTFTVPSGATLSGAGAITVPSGGSLTIDSGATITNNGTNGGGFGKVLQVAQGTYSTQVSTGGTTYVTTNLSASITPSSTSNKVLVLAHINSFVAYGGATPSGYIALYRDGSALVNNAARQGIAGDSLSSLVINYLDSPSSTSSLTYEVYFRKGVGTTVYCHYGNVPSTIILMEIAG